jgi:hypothetical protein
LPRRSCAGAPTSRSSTCSQAPGQRRDQAIERLVAVDGDAEASGRLQGHEAVDRAAEGARGVDRVVAVEVPRAQDGVDDVDGLARGRLVLGVVGCRRRHGRGVEPGMGVGVGAVRARRGAEGIRTRAADGGVAQRGGQLAHAAQGERPQQAAAAVDVVVERGGAHAERAGHAGERHGVEALGVGDQRRRVDDALHVESRARHWATRWPW